jgi:hypothetical protein
MYLGGSEACPGFLWRLNFNLRKQMPCFALLAGGVGNDAKTAEARGSRLLKKVFVIMCKHMFSSSSL